MKIAAAKEAYKDFARDEKIIGMKIAASKETNFFKDFARNSKID